MQNKKRCVIIGAAEIKDYKHIKSLLKDDDFFIVCDAGLNHVRNLKINPDLIAGDFDSFKKKIPSRYKNIRIITLPCEKDDTDTFFAVKEAVKLGFNDFLLIGVTGQRLDHTMANISALVYLHKNNCRAKIADDYSLIQIVEKNTVKIQSGCSYFSLIPLTGKASGINIRGAHYPLKNGQVDIDYIFTTSNQVLEGQTAEVSVEDGLLLVITGR